MTNSKSTSAKSEYCVVYRMGGTANFSWHRSVAMTREEAQAAKVQNERMGYKTMIVKYALSLAIGLPETYE